jgi:twitching motility two-component system response regulator PilH
VKTILVAEDDDDLRELVSCVLARAGYHVIEATDGLEALARLELASSAPDLVLLDLMMPRMSGTEVLARMRGRKNTEALPVVVVSAIADRLKPSGADAYLQKPVLPEQLLDVVQQTLQRTNQS